MSQLSALLSCFILLAQVGADQQLRLSVRLVETMASEKSRNYAVPNICKKSFDWESVRAHTRLCVMSTN